jgi:hypothetical protein
MTKIIPLHEEIETGDLWDCQRRPSAATLEVESKGDPTEESNPNLQIFTSKIQFWTYPS